MANRDVEEPAKADKLGLSVRPLGADERKNADTEGYLLVEDVTGPAAAAGVRPGDVILGINGKPVKSIAELKSATNNGNKTVWNCRDLERNRFSRYAGRESLF